MVTRDRQDLARIMAIRPVEAVRIIMDLIRPVHDVAEMQKECRIERAGTSFEIRTHIVANAPGFVTGAPAAVAKCMEAYLAELLNFVDPGRTDYGAEIHRTRAACRRHRAEI